jgi:hypothetical protein
MSLVITPRHSTTTSSIAVLAAIRFVIISRRGIVAATRENGATRRRPLWTGWEVRPAASLR